MQKGDSAGVPGQWSDKMKGSWRPLGPFGTAARMVRAYPSQLYEPAAASAALMLEDHAGRGKALVPSRSRRARQGGSNARWANHSGAAISA